MNEYKIGPEGLRDIRKRLIRRTITVYAIAYPITMVVLALTAFPSMADLPYLIGGAVACVIFAYISGNGLIRRQMDMYVSYTVVLSEILLTRESAVLPTIEIYLNEIRKIELLKNGAIIVRGRTRQECIGIPKQMEGFDELKRALEGIMPLTPTNVLIQARMLSLLYRFIFLGSFIYFVVTPYRGWLFYVTGLLALGLSTWSFIATQRSKHLSEAAKRRSLLYIVTWSIIVSQLVFQWIHF
ncbi:MAG TPA: hypothetical protein VL547_10015 [Dinghuibacter sp.]|uniref:hypothetical protein n=1 Tax=Dinghuibacter sp. TaxID=2024697 RepID=UPI002C0C8F12|nr:hypothetical protein [Dinghuibacter sp.]HTJ12350.1 hypothetical protein [Dinghuibacter sp.]